MFGENYDRQHVNFKVFSSLLRLSFIFGLEKERQLETEEIIYNSRKRSKIPIPRNFRKSYLPPKSIVPINAPKPQSALFDSQSESQSQEQSTLQSITDLSLSNKGRTKSGKILRRSFTAETFNIKSENSSEKDEADSSSDLSFTWDEPPLGNSLSEFEFHETHVTSSFSVKDKDLIDSVNLLNKTCLKYEKNLKSRATDMKLRLISIEREGIGLYWSSESVTK